VLEIDTERMVHGTRVEATLTGGEKKGYPWSVILDAEGKALIDSDGPAGNIGCPVTAAEAAHFMDMLKTTRQRLTDDELAVIRAEHDAFAEPIRRSLREAEERRRKR
jgi:hypothetical protein